MDVIISVVDSTVVGLRVGNLLFGNYILVFENNIFQKKKTKKHTVWELAMVVVLVQE